MSLPRSGSVALFGAGRVGTTVAYVLTRAGHELIGVASPTQASAKAASQRLGCKVFSDPVELAGNAETVLIGAPDHELADAAEAIAPGVGRNTLACHFSGVSGTAPLASIRRRGGATAALHPVQSFVDFDRAASALAGCAWGVTCANEDLHRSMALVADTGGHGVRVAEEDRPVWHAAAAMASNGLAALVADAEMLLAGIGIERPLEILAPLIQGTVANLGLFESAVDALTGPVVRGEREVVQRHLDAFAAQRDDVDLENYSRVAEMILRAARRSGRLDPEAGKAIEEVLAR
ncbi:MAG: Rossmann-like and DUF2520 domain-containing protein [Actinomycetota bacterium]